MAAPFDANQVSSVESEQAIIGGFLINNENYFSFEHELRSDDFYVSEHKAIFDFIGKVAAEGQQFDYVVIADAIKQRKPENHQKTLLYLGELVRQTPDQLNLKHYIKIVKNYALIRRLHATLRDISEKSSLGHSMEDIAGLVDYAEQKILGLNIFSSSAHSFQSASSLVGGVFEEIEHLSSSDGLPGTESGFVDLDKMTLGFQPGDLIVVAGRPSMGKTAFSMNIAEYVAYHLDKSVAVFSLEMSASQLIYRLLSSISGISSQSIRQGNISDGHNGWPKLNEAIEQILKQKKLFINDQMPMTPTDIRSQCRRFKKEHPDLGLIMIDYLQLIYADQSKPNRNQEITEISYALKGIAKELAVPVVVLSQLSRGVEQRDNKRPRMSDLRESGSIEQDADLIMMIYRDAVYNKNTEDQNVAEINIVKQRNGPIGGVRLHFDARRIRFSNLQSTAYDHLGVTGTHPNAGLPTPSDDEERYVIEQVTTPGAKEDIFAWRNLSDDVASKAQKYHSDMAAAFSKNDQRDTELYERRHKFYETVREWMQKK